MVLSAIKRRIFVSTYLVMLVTILCAPLGFGGVDVRAASTDLTKVITITKQWIGDNVNNRPDDVTVYLNKTTSTLMPGCRSGTINCPGGATSTLEHKMKTLAGEGTMNVANTTIRAIRKATDAQYEAVESSLTVDNEVQVSGEKTYMWFENGVIYFYSFADNIYLSANSSGLFRSMKNLTDASGLAYFNTTYVTDMNRMFQDTPTISDISVLSKWDTGNVTDMSFMFGSNYSSGKCVSPMNFANLIPLSNWDVSSVTDMNSMFKCNASLYNIAPLTNWDVTNVTNMSQMFNRSGVSDPSPIKDWNVINVNRVTSGSSDGFRQMFGNVPNIASLWSTWPAFTKRAGAWDSTGAYTPSGYPTGAVAKPHKTQTADQQICSGSAWNKSQENVGIWTCTLIVSNDDSIYKAWEDATNPELANYDVSNPESDKITVENNAASLTNISMSANNCAINLRKIVSGDAANRNKYFTFQVNAFDENGNLVPGYSRSIQLKHNETMTVLVFTIPQEYSYEIIETGTEYTAYHGITKTDGGEEIKAQSAGVSTGRITPTENQTVTFTNIKTNSPDKTMTIFKKWEGDISADRPDITVTLNKTTADLIDGANLNMRMKQLAGSTASTSAADTNIIAIQMASKAQYEAVASSLGSNNQVQASGSANPIYMWFNGGVIYFYSPADNIYMHANSASAFQNLVSVTDISALEHFNTAYVTNMKFMFMDSSKITSINELSGWDTGNVTDMGYMFSATYVSTGYRAMNISDLSPIAGWNTQKVTSMDSMFKCAGAIRNLDALENWNVQNLTNMNQMFNRAGLTSMEGIKDWNVTRVSNFTNTLNNMPSLTTKLEFTVRPGSWDSNGTYTPTDPAISGSAPTVTKVRSADQQTCSGNNWNKTQDASGIWSCSFTVSNDGSIYKTWENPVAGYTESALINNPTTVMSDTATITNTREGYTITYKKMVMGNMGDITQNFSFPIRVYDLNGDEVPAYATTETLKHNRYKSIIIPAGYSYQISESASGYAGSYQIIDDENDSTIATSTGFSTGIITPTEDQTVIFTNSRGGAPITGVFDSPGPFIIIAVMGVSSFALFSSHLMVARLKRKVRIQRGGRM